MATVSHYKLTGVRRAEIRHKVAEALRKRVRVLQASCPLTGPKLEKLAFTDDQLRKLYAASEFYGSYMERTNFALLHANMRADAGDFTVLFHVSPNARFFWPDHASIYLGLARRADIDCYGYAANRARFEDCVLNLDAPRPDDAERQKIEAETREWLGMLLTAMRRFDLGASILTQVLQRSNTLTDVTATTPFVRPLLSKEMQQEMDRAPKRTIDDYHVMRDEKIRISALKHLVAESMMMPETPTRDITTHITVFYGPRKDGAQ